jgi:hypothetical protein
MAAYSPAGARQAGIRIQENKQGENQGPEPGKMEGPDVEPYYPHGGKDISLKTTNGTAWLKSTKPNQTYPQPQEYF